MPRRPQNKRQGAEVIRDEFWEEAPTAAKHIRDFARTGSVKVKPMKLSPSEAAAGYQVLVCDDPKAIVKSCEGILDAVLPGKGEGGELQDLPKMSMIQLGKALFHDGLTPSLEKPSELDDYICSAPAIAGFQPSDLAEVGDPENGATADAPTDGADPDPPEDVPARLVDSNRSA